MQAVSIVPIPGIMILRAKARYATMLCMTGTSDIKVHARISYALMEKIAM